MTDQQLYLAAIGIPTFAILVGILTNVLQHSAVNARFNSVDARFNLVETRLDSLEARVETRLDSLDAKFEARLNNLDAKLDLKLDTLTGKVVDIDNRVTRIEAKLGIG